MRNQGYLCWPRQHSVDAGLPQSRSARCYSARWDQLQVKGDQLLIEAADPTFPARFKLEGDKLVASKPRVVAMPSRAVLYITTGSPFTIPDDAVVILADRAPGDNWYYALLYVLLLGFVALNGVILVGRLRARRR